jgi:hypothetical protein
MPTVGARASHAWLDNLELEPVKPWYVEIALDTSSRRASDVYRSSSSRFHLNVYPEEWGVFFCTGGKTSWVRVTDEPFVHGRDDFQLLADLPPLDRIETLVRDLEDRNDLRFRRDLAMIRTNITGAKNVLRKWLARL